MNILQRARRANFLSDFCLASWNKWADRKHLAGGIEMDDAGDCTLNLCERANVNGTLKFY